MKEIAYELQGIARVVVRCHADLRAESTEEGALTGKVSGRDAVSLTRKEDTLVVVCLDDAWLRFPRQAALEIEKVGGDAYMQDLPNLKLLGKVGGDLVAQGFDMLSIQHVGGDCLLRNVSSVVTIAKVGGDLLVDRIGLDCLVDSVGGDADIRRIGGELTVRAGGDISLRQDALYGKPATLKAGGDLQLYLPEVMDATLDLTSQGHEIEVDFSDEQVTYEQRFLQLVRGSGAAMINAMAGGDLSVCNHGWEMSELDEEFDHFDDEWELDFSNLISQRILGGLESDKMERAAKKAAERAEQAVQRATERMQAAMRRVEARTAGMAAEYGSHPVWPVPPTPPSPPIRPARPAAPKAASEPAVDVPAEAANPALDTERDLVLQMLKEKKISVDEAERLLDALDKAE